MNIASNVSKYLKFAGVKRKQILEPDIWCWAM